MSEKSQITKSDVARLLSEPSARTRAETARKVGAFFAAAELTDTERAIAGDIFRAMVHDAEVRVRKALAETIKSSPDLPREVAVALAKDVHDVALPVIESARVLTDEDLIEIIGSDDEERQMAVARRATVSETVSDALVDTGREAVVSTLVSNEGADIAEATFERVLEKFPDSERVTAGIAKRSKLPLTVAERLVTMVTDSLRDHLIAHHDLPEAMATDILMESRERATVGLLGRGTKRQDMLGLVDQLHRNGRLTPTLIIRALCMGDVGFFEAALAKRAEIPVVNAFQLVHYKDEVALPRLFKRARMPDSLIHVARIGVAIAEELRETGGDDREKFRKLMIERVLTQLDEAIDGDNLDYLIGKLGRRAA
ncbi:MAG: DUF2336 domain-containing protein [Rhodothalassiaceae bacterium]